MGHVGQRDIGDQKRGRHDGHPAGDALTRCVAVQGKSPRQQAERIGLCTFQKRIAEQAGDEGGKEKKKDEQNIEIVGKR